MRRFLLALGLVVALAFAIRAIHVLALLRSPVGDLLILDARYYHQEALRILGLAERVDPPGVRFMNVGYPYFLAPLYAVLGPSVAAALWLQAAIGALTCGVLGLATRRLVGREAPAILAALAYAVYAPAVFYDGLLLTPTAINALLAVAMLCATTRPVPAGVAGVALGLASLLRASNLLLVPVLAVVLMKDRRAATALALGATIVVLPVVMTNGLVHDAWVPVSANGGMNFWTGNHAGANGVYAAPPFLDNQNAGGEHRDFLREARRRAGDERMTLAASSRYWLGEGLAAIGADPSGWARLEAVKLTYFWNAVEAKTNVGMPFVAGISPVLRVAPGFSALAVVGVAGIVLLLATGPRLAGGLALSLVLVPLAASLLFFVSGEYRHPASLGLALAAGVALEAVWRTRSSPRVRAVAVAAGVVTLVMTMWEFPDLRNTTHPHIDRWNYTREIVRDVPADSVEAKERYERAVRVVADDAGSPMLADARLAAHHFGAVHVGDPEAVRAALAAAREIYSLLPPSALAGPSAYARHLRESVPARVREVAGLPIVRDDPVLAREAGDLLRVGTSPPPGRTTP